MEVKRAQGKLYIGDDSNAPLAVIEYSLKEEGVIDVYRTFVSDELRGKGVANILFYDLIKISLENGWKIIPTCSYIDKMFEKNPELAHLLK